MADSSHSFKALRDAQQSARQLIIEGALWLVYELPPVTLDRRSSPSLVFESETAVRRVRDFPADWRKLSDDDLFALSWTI